MVLPQPSRCCGGAASDPTSSATRVRPAAPGARNLAASLLIYRQTHSELLLGVLNFSQFIPIFLLAPLAGGASDRWNRRQLLLVTQSVAVVLSGGLGLLAYLDLAATWVVISDAVAPRRRSRR